MPLQQLKIAPGISRENTRYASEGKWYESDKIRFRQGTPEQIGGWIKLTVNTFLGVCRSLFAWVTLASIKYIGVGTNLKFYVNRADEYHDITPIRLRTATAALVNPFNTTNLSADVTVNDLAHGALAGDFVTFTGVVAVGGIPALDFNKQHTIVSITSADAYVITVLDAATSTVVGGGGAAVTVSYKYHNELLGANPFSVVSGSTKVTVTDTAHGAMQNDFVTFSGATAVGGLTLSGEYQVQLLIDVNTYTITAASAASATTTGGGSAVRGRYEINTGPEAQLPAYGWGAGVWGSSTWGNSTQSTGVEIRLWTQYNYGEDLVFGPRYGGIYYWTASTGTGFRGVNITDIPGASYAPVVQHAIMVSDASRFVLAFGCNALDSTTLDPMLIRWSDQENILEWNPQVTNQAGSLRLSNGSEIYTALQVRQEILVWTDTALYSLQYLGAPLVWGATLLDANVTSAHPNSAALASGVVYWMGIEKFYMYDGRVQTLNCALRNYVFSDMNFTQAYQVFATTNEAFNEVWWFYCSADSTVVDRYVVYNYLENLWYYGTMGRTAWIDSGVNAHPIAATYNNQLVYQEVGVVDGEGATDAAINSYITSSQFDIGDGHNFAFVWRMLPDLTFAGSDETVTPQVTMTLLPLQNSGSGYTVPPSVGGSSSATVSRIGAYEVDQFTGQVNTRIRARQMSLKVESTTLGTHWQLGYPRIDIRPDGRK